MSFLFLKIRGDNSPDIGGGFKDLYDTPAPEARAAEGQTANEMGMNGQHHAQDSMVAHVTPGEVVIPLSAQTPQLMQYLYQTLGQDMLKYTVGSGYEQRNPTSGLPAFKDDSCTKLWDDIEDQEAIVERLTKQLENDPGNIPLARELGNAERKLWELQDSLGFCGTPVR